MIIKTDMNLSSFEFWGGAIATAKLMTDEQLTEVEEYLDEYYPEGVNATDLNEMFWTDDDFVAQICGFTDFENLMEFNKRNA